MTNERIFSLGELIAPTTALDFVSKHWEKKHLHVCRHDAVFYGQLFSLADVDRSILSTYGVAQDILTLIPPPDSERKTESYQPAKLTMDKVYDAYNRGDTVRLVAVQRTWAPLAMLAATIGRAFSAEVNINFYLTPPNSQGFRIHIDAHEVFILQVEGAKDWFIYEPGYRLPIETLSDSTGMNARFKSPLEEEEVQLIEQVHLAQGDLLYIPRGFPHKAIASSAPSLHLTVSIHPLYWVDVLKQAVEGVTLDALELRQALPPGFSWDPTARDRMDDVFQSCLELVMEKARLDRAVEALVKGRLASRPYPADGHFEQLTHADEIGPDSLLTHREGLECLVECSGATAAIFYANRHVKGPAGIAPALRYVRDHPRFRAAELPALTENAKLVLARRLVREGLLRRLPETDATKSIEELRAAGVAS